MLLLLVSLVCRGLNVAAADVVMVVTFGLSLVEAVVLGLVWLVLAVLSVDIGTAVVVGAGAGAGVVVGAIASECHWVTVGWGRSKGCAVETPIFERYSCCSPMDIERLVGQALPDGLVGWLGCLPIVRKRENETYLKDGGGGGGRGVVGCERSWGR